MLAGLHALPCHVSKHAGTPWVTQANVLLGLLPGWHHACIESVCL